jgi:hypothetical protein
VELGAALPAEPTSTPAEPTSTPAEPTSTPAEPTSTPAEPTSTPSEPTSTPTPGPVTVTIAKNCDSYSIDAGVDNGGSVPVTVGVAERDGVVFSSVTVGPGGTGLLRVEASFSNSYHLTYTRLDTGHEVGMFDEDLFVCAHRGDHLIEVVSGTTYTSTLSCPLFLTVPRKPSHGRVGTVGDGFGGHRFTYTPAPGYLGRDRFDYACNTSAELFGAIFITVLPAPPARLVPVPPAARPGLAATGTASPAPQVALGGGLVLIGTVIVWVGRRSHRRT